MERQVSVAARAGGGSRVAPFGLLGDERLARLVAAGHSRAFSVVYERHHQALYRYCRSILRDDADAQDALQSTFAAAFAALRRSRPDAPIRPWLYRIAHNEAVSLLRRRRPTTDLSAASNWPTTSVEDEVVERAELDLLLRDLRELNERQRSALVMRELSGLSHEEIAIALDTSVGAAKQTIYEARRSLFEFAEGRAVPCDEIRRTISDADGRLLRSRRVRAHLRECAGCAVFAAAIPERGRELHALAPMLPAVLAAGMLERVAGAGVAHSAGGGWAGLATGAAGKAAGATLAANALAGVAVVASATVGVTVGVDKLMHGTHPVAFAPAATAVHSVARAPAPADRVDSVARAPAPADRVPAARPLARTASHASSRAAPAARHDAGTSHGHRTAVPSPIRSRGPAPPPAPGSSSVTAGRPIAGPGRVASAPGHSGSALGHNEPPTPAPGHSGSAPGHNKPPTTPAPGNSGSAPGNSGSAPGHNTPTTTPPASSASVTTGLPAATTPSPPATPPGAAVSAKHQH
jgi:RNA polymerase sigma factor (sigma-70 family)